MPSPGYDDAISYDSATTRYDGLLLATSELLQRPGLRKVFLAEITAGLLCQGWVLTDINLYKVALPEKGTVISVQMNNVELESRASIGALQLNRGWYISSTHLYVNPVIGTPWDYTIMATVAFYFATAPKIFSNQYYTPIFDKIPAISLRIEERFSGVGQVSGGTVELINNAGYFDELKSLFWNYGTVVIKMGLDYLQGAAFVEQIYSEYITLGTWLVEDHKATDADFTLQLKDLKSRLLKKIPYEVFTREAYPYVDKDSIGKPLPIAYGRILGCKPIPINPGTNRFKVANHGIFSFDGLRRKQDDVWIDLDFTTQDISTGEFTVDTPWTAGQEISVDFTGKRNPDGSPMLNASDIVSDLLTYSGETNQDVAAFLTAHNRLDLGPDNYGRRTVIRRPSIYLDTLTDVLDVFGKINELVGSYLYPDVNGQWIYVVWTPQPSEGLLEFNKTHSLTLEEETDVTNIFSKVAVKHSMRKQEGFSEVATEEQTETQYANRLKSAQLEEREISCSNIDDAETHTERLLVSEGLPVNRIRNTVPHTGFLLTAGSQIHVTDSRAGLDEVLEVMQFNADMTGNSTKLICTRLREVGRHCGFVTAAADVLPSRFASEAGYGAGSMTWNNAWSDTIKAWARQNIVYATDPNGFADTTDAESVTSHCV